MNVTGLPEAPPVADTLSRPPGLAPTGGVEVKVMVCTVAAATGTSCWASTSHGTVAVWYWWAWMRQVRAEERHVASEIVHTTLGVGSIEKTMSRPAELVAVTR